MASRLKVVEPTATELAHPPSIDFTPAPTRKRHAGWTAEKQRTFIERLALTGSAGQARPPPGSPRARPIASATRLAPTASRQPGMRR